MLLSIPIISYLFECFGIPKNAGRYSIMETDYRLKKELAVEMEDGEVIQRPLWGVVGQVGNSQVKILVTDLTIAKDREFILIFQLDDLTVYALRMEDNAKAYMLHDDKWIELSNLLLAKLLVGVEQLNELLVNWQTFTNYQDHYKYLVSFLNYMENTNGSA